MLDRLGSGAVSADADVISPAGEPRPDSGDDPPPAGAFGVVRRFASAAQRNDERVADYLGDFEGIGADYKGKLAIVETRSGIRTSASREQGGLRLRARWADDALGAVFLWGDALTIDGNRHPTPCLVIAGPGTEVDARHQGGWRNLRVGVHGAAFDELLANPATAPVFQAWSRPGIQRPTVPAALEWRLQRQILLAASFAEQASLVDGRPEIALQVAADEVVGALVAALHGVEPGRFDASGVIREPHRLVRAAIELLESSPDEPVSVSGVCRRLGVSERTLQRAFQESLGVGLRAYERERRLRGVHGAILAEGNRRTITDIAMSFGFWHLGRFAGAYKLLFGCSPTETRRRVWDLRGAAPCRFASSRRSGSATGSISGR